MSKCRYEAMGMGHCDSTPEQIPCFPCRERQGGTPRNTYRSPVSTWFEHLDRKMRAAAGVPSAVLTGTPSGSGPDWRREYMGEWTMANAAMEAEEKRQHSETNPCSRCGKPTRKGGIHFCTALWQNSMDGSRHDSLVDALQYALAGRRSGKTATMTEYVAEQRAQGKDVAVIHGHDRGMPVYDFPCSCGRTFRGTDRDRGKRCEHEIPACYNPSQTEVARSVARIKDAAKPKPPTLRAWLGDRVSELGPWAEVLREQPVPAGMIVAWHWDHSGSEWILLAADKDDAPGCGTYVPTDLTGVFDRKDDSTSITCWLESLQMALFTRHPAVKPEPKPAAFPWDPYPEASWC